MSKEVYFKEKVVWVTGASSGIGKELCIQLARLGAKLVLSSRNEEALTKLRNELHSKEDHIILPLDLSQSNSFESILKNVLQKFGRVDILIQNGGVSQRGTAFDSSEMLSVGLWKLIFSEMYF